jgi:hypothetical protein
MQSGVPLVTMHVSHPMRFARGAPPLTHCDMHALLIMMYLSLVTPHANVAAPWHCARA